jgi:DNA-binding winged helix-turn-helix (wHTH) protein
VKVHRFKSGERTYFLDPKTQELWVGVSGPQERVYLSGAALRLLMYFLQHPRVVMSQRDLSKKVIGPQANRGALNKAIGELRGVLGDKRVIEDATKLGFRFTPATAWVELDPPTADVQVEAEANITIQFDPDFAPKEVTEILAAFADYYRACGGAGFEIDFETQEALVTEPVYA